ncbi:hypothetical protein SBA3_1170008 [Candidatus Sulfopaludibacter sp. SbA3]|nr:hypothetical protein SBA3_1170008 [Candidatus Sulfopaludibacter sp. SbA3]
MREEEAQLQGFSSAVDKKGEESLPARCGASDSPRSSHGHQRSESERTGSASIGAIGSRGDQ